MGPRGTLPLPLPLPLPLGVAGHEGSTTVSSVSSQRGLRLLADGARRRARYEDRRG
ncbi:hypothetical protein [Streptomyces sp. NPDC001070]